MSIVATYNTQVLPNAEVLKVGPQNILYETVDSRENQTTGNVTFQFQSKGENCLLDAQVLLRLKFKITPSEAFDTTKEERLAVKMPLNIIKNSTFLYNGTSITAQPSIGAEIETIQYDTPVSVASIQNGYMSDTVYAFGKLDDQSDGFSKHDYERWKRITWLRQNITDVAGSTVKNLEVLIPLQFPPFKSARSANFYGAMSNMLPFINNGTELQLQFWPNLSQRVLEICDNANGRTYQVAFQEQKAQLELRWYTLPPSMALADVYTIKNWTKDIVYATSSNVTTQDADIQSTFDAKIQQKPDYLAIYARPDLNGAEMTATDLEKNTLGNVEPFLEVKTLDIRIDTAAGSFVTTVDGQYLRFLTKQNLKGGQYLSDSHLQRSKNFVLLSAEQISHMTTMPAGVFSWTTLKIVATFKGRAHIANTDGKSYVPYLLLYSGHGSLRITRNTCEVMRDGISESQFAAIQGGAPAAQSAAIPSGAGIRGAYTSRFR